MSKENNDSWGKGTIDHQDYKDEQKRRNQEARARIDMLTTKEEEQLHEIINRLRADYEKAAKPYIDRLIQLHSLRLPAITWITKEQARVVGLIK